MLGNLREHILRSYLCAENFLAMFSTSSSSPIFGYQVESQVKEVGKEDIRDGAGISERQGFTLAPPDPSENNSYSSVSP